MLCAYTLINIARIFEAEALKRLLRLDNNEPPKSNEQRDSDWKDFCGDIQRVNINFKNCFLTLGRGLERLLFPIK